MLRIKTFLSTVLILLTLQISNAQPPQTWSAGEIRLALEKLNTLGSVLYVAAHPDDENTRLLSYLANEKKYRTVYISITRGDGGQNLIGKEQGEELGMIRTQELLAARRVDGAEQFFSRSNDFGYSKTPEETFTIWNRDEALADLVWAIRKFRPDVIVNRFPAVDGRGHGHHTASAILALDAFKLSADPKQFPEQLKFVKPWQAKRIFLNSFNFRNHPITNFEGHLKVDVGGFSPLLGQSYGEIAAESRSMHKSQGFGVARSRGTLPEHFKKLDGDTIVNEIFENINTSWNRIKGGNKIEALVTKAIAEFDMVRPEKTIKVLSQILPLVRGIDDEYWKQVKEKEVLTLIQACSGLWFEANAKEYYATPGDSLHLTVSAISRSLEGVLLERITINNIDTTLNRTLSLNELTSFPKSMIIPANAPLSNPYWLELPFTNGSYLVNNQELIGKPWSDPYINATFNFSIEGQKISYTVPVNFKFTDPVKGEVYRPFEIVPFVSLEASDGVMIFTGNTPKPMTIKIKSAVDSLSGTLKFTVPNGWNVQPQKMDVAFKGKGTEIVREILVTPPTPTDNISTGNTSLNMVFESGTKKAHQTVRRIEYDHIPALISLKNSEVKLVATDLKSTVKKIGYIEGAGDDVAKYLKQAGFDVELLDENKILKSSLAGYGAIITGIRAYNTIENMESYYQPLMKYVEDGGNLIVQYNTSNFISTLRSMIGPYSFSITRNRVTDENAVPVFDNPKHFLLNYPNKITESDFDNWVQERGLYFAGEMAPEYKSIISWKDPGEELLNGGLIIAKSGKGYFMYTGISFFRQLPAGVPGAYRLLTNMINAGKKTDAGDKVTK